MDSMINRHVFLVSRAFLVASQWLPCLLLNTFSDSLLPGRQISDLQVTNSKILCTMAQASGQRRNKRWLPLEANPEVMNDFAEKLGLQTAAVSFCDVYGLDEALLCMVPKPVLGVLMLFPISEASRKAKAEEEERIKATGQTVSPKLYYMKQTIGNACGTIGMLHALCNNYENIPVAPSSFLAEFMAAAKSMTPEQRGNFLENPPDGAPDIEDAHKNAAAAGDTAPPNLDEVVDLHFVCFVEKDGGLYELDGTKFGPVYHGPSTSDTLLQDATGAIKKYIESSMGKMHIMRFSIFCITHTAAGFVSSVLGGLPLNPAAMTISLVQCEIDNDNVRSNSIQFNVIAFTGTPQTIEAAD